MNTEKLRAVIRTFEKDPTRIHMGRWIQDFEYPCKTVCCIAGCAISNQALQEKISIEDVLKEYSAEEDVGVFSDPARRILEISEWQAHRLFIMSAWPQHYKEAYENALDSPTKKLEILRQRIERFIRTNGEE